MRDPRPAALRLLLGPLLATLLGCAGHRAPEPSAAPAAGPRQRIAVLPLEDLSGQSGAADRMTRVLFTVLAQAGVYEVVEPGTVDMALSDARVRSTGMLSREQIQSLSTELGTRWLLTGSALEFGRVRTPDGEVPSVGIALRLIDGRDGRVCWADQRYRNGDDRETVFGWGHESDADRLAQHTLAELVQALRVPADGDSIPMSREGRP
jgi:TolB-like protein